MLIGMYEHLEQAHAAIRDLQHDLGLTSKEIGCAFEPSHIRVPTLFRRVFPWLPDPSVPHSDQTCNAEFLSRMILPRSLRTRALDLLRRGGALVSVHPKSAQCSDTDLFRLLNANGAREIVVVRDQRRAVASAPVARKPLPQTRQVKVLGALETLLDEAEPAGGRAVS